MDMRPNMPIAMQKKGKKKKSMKNIPEERNLGGGKKTRMLGGW